jgi:hypothetical protein
MSTEMPDEAAIRMAAVDDHVAYLPKPKDLGGFSQVACQRIFEFKPY